MMNRNKQPIDIIWLHMDAMHASYSAAINAMRAQHENQGSFKLGINLNNDGTEALVKVAGVRAGWPVGKSWNAAVKRVFIEADHVDASALVRDLLWEPPEFDEFA